MDTTSNQTESLVQVPMHSQPLGHISIGVTSASAAKTFYTTVLAPLGLRLVYESQPGKEPHILGYGPNEDHEIINIFEYGKDAHAPGKGCHIALNALSRTAVTEFHDAAVKAGGKSNGKPGVRDHYGENYFAAFVIDPDGWRLEAVCKTVPETD